MKMANTIATYLAISASLVACGNRTTCPTSIVPPRATTDTPSGPSKPRAFVLSRDPTPHEVLAEHQTALALLFNARSHAAKTQRRLFDKLLKEIWAIVCTEDPYEPDPPREIVGGDIHIFDPLVGVEMDWMGCARVQPHGVTLRYVDGKWEH